MPTISGYFSVFLKEMNPSLKTVDITQFPVSVLDQIKSVDLEEYQEYLKVYESSDKQITNGKRAETQNVRSPELLCLLLQAPADLHESTMLVDMPKLHEKTIVRLEPNETASLLDYIEHCGDELTGQQKMYYEKTKYRDLAIVTLLLGTGIRVSECVGLDIQDVDFENNGIKGYPERRQ